MKKTNYKKHLSLFLCVLLVAAMAIFTTGCNDKTETPQTSGKQEITDATKLGEGETTFIFQVIDAAGVTKSFEISTGKTIVGEALQELGLISGEEGPYGLYVKTVDGTTLDYDKDGKYWAFYINGEYASSGADTTEINPNDIYAFKADK